MIEIFWESTKSFNQELKTLCASSVLSESLRFKTTPEMNFTTETQRAQRKHRENKTRGREEAHLMFRGYALCDGFKPADLRRIALWV